MLVLSIVCFEAVIVCELLMFGPCWHVQCAATYLFAASVCLSFVRFSVHCAIGYGNVYVYGHIYKCFVMFCLVVLFFLFLFSYEFAVW